MILPTFKKLAILFISILLFHGCSSSFKFVVMSDSRGDDKGVNTPVFTRLIKHCAENNPDIQFVIFPGDMVDGSKTNPDSTRQQLEFWKSLMNPFYDNPNLMEPKVIVTVGNHEIQHRADEETFRKVFPAYFNNGPDDEKGATFSFDFESTHFTVLNSDRWYYGSPFDTTDDKRDWHYIKHDKWMEKDISDARIRGAKHIIVITHEPVFPIGGHLRDGLAFLGRDLKLPLDSLRCWYLDQRARIWDICKTYKVDAYVCGHEHLYGRESVDGIYQITAGSSGAPIYYFNPKYGENTMPPEGGLEFTYDEALKYYKILGYHYLPGQNAQISDDFFGARAFHYCVFEVRRNEIEVSTYGAEVVPGTLTEMQPEIKLIDNFIIPRPK